MVIGDLNGGKDRALASESGDHGAFMWKDLAKVAQIERLMVTAE
jgi:hypothetical protein